MTTQPQKFVLHVRVPAWVAGVPTVRINGVAAEMSAGAGSYVSIIRTWRSGDRVELEMPMQLRMEPMPDETKQQLVPFREVEGGRPYSIFWRVS